jgi:hypothetical protein
MTWPLILAAVAAGGLGLAIGLPAWRSWRSRASRDRNTERYLAWRGRADRTEPNAQELSPAERRRIVLGAILGVVAVACLVIGLSAG